MERWWPLSATTIMSPVWMWSGGSFVQRGDCTLQCTESNGSKQKAASYRIHLGVLRIFTRTEESFAPSQLLLHRLDLFGHSADLCLGEVKCRVDNLFGTGMCA